MDIGIFRLGQSWHADFRSGILTWFIPWPMSSIVKSVNHSQVEDSDRKSVGPDRPRQNISMSKCPDGTYQCPYVLCVQKYLWFLRAFKKPISRLSCIQNYIWPDFCAFQTKICALRSRLSCVQKHLYSDFRAVKIFCAFFVRSNVRLSRYSWVYVQTYHISCTQHFYNVFTPLIDILCGDGCAEGPKHLVPLKLLKGARWKCSLKGAPVIKAWFCFATSAMVYNSRREIFRTKAKSWIRLFLFSTFCNFWNQARWCFLHRVFTWVSTLVGVLSQTFALRLWNSCFHSNNFMRSRVTMFKLCFVQNCLCPHFCAFKVAYVQIFVPSKLPMSRLSYVHSCFQTV